jgi:hypothetical protein
MSALLYTFLTRVMDLSDRIVGSRLLDVRLAFRLPNFISRASSAQLELLVHAARGVMSRGSAVVPCEL